MSDNVQVLPALEFDDLTLLTLPVRVGKEWYILTEADEGASVEWKNAQLRSTRMVDGKITSFGDMASSEPHLVSLCLYKAEVDAKGTPSLPMDRNGQPDRTRRVSREVLMGWPGRLVRRLFEEAKKLSELEDEETEEILVKRLEDTQKKLDDLREGKTTAAAKNGQDATEFTSS